MSTVSGNNAASIFFRRPKRLSAVNGFNSGWCETAIVTPSAMKIGAIGSF
jgi:hypothetical protein